MPYNETAYKASQKYKAGNIKRVPLDMQKSTYEEIKIYAESRGESVNGFIKRAISEAMERDSSSSAVPTQASPQAPEIPQDGLLVLVEIGYDPMAGKPLYSEKGTGKQYTVEAISISGEVSEDITDDLPF